jgi:putative addiction module component (TIGR02574 family)
MASAEERLPADPWQPGADDLEQVRRGWPDHEARQAKVISWEQIGKEIDQRIADRQARREHSRPSRVDPVLQLAASLEPEERLRLIAQLWASLPADHWAAPSEDELQELERRLNDADPDGLAIVPWSITRRMAANRPLPIVVPSRIYSAPRRFDLATIFAVMSAYSLLFALMSSYHFPPLASSLVGGYVTIVGIGQALLFGGRKPRQASIVTGAATLFLGALPFYEPRLYASPLILLGMAMCLTVGAVLGYLAGTLVGGVFLVADGLRKIFARLTNRRPAEAPEAEAI